jgi:hypothetical protein
MSFRAAPFLLARKASPLPSSGFRHSGLSHCDRTFDTKQICDYMSRLRRRHSVVNSDGALSALIDRLLAKRDNADVDPISRSQTFLVAVRSG